jgi:hypothetical protein
LLELRSKAKGNIEFGKLRRRLGVEPVSAQKALRVADMYGRRPEISAAHMGGVGGADGAVAAGAGQDRDRGRNYRRWSFLTRANSSTARNQSAGGEEGGIGGVGCV